MKKKLISVVAIVAVIALLGATLFLLNKPADEEPLSSEPSIEVEYVLGGAEAEPVKSVEVKNSHGSFTVEVKDPSVSELDLEYSLKGYEGFPVTPSRLAPAIRYATKLTARSLVAEGRDAFATYGLDKPVATVEIRLANGGSEALLVGNAAPGSEGYYATSSNSDKVYLVTENYVSCYLARALDFMDLTLTEGAPDADTFKDVTLGGTVREEPIVLKPYTEARENSFSSHYIASPLSFDLDMDRGATLISSAFGLTASAAVDVASDDATLEKYDLKEPYSTISVASETVPAFSLSTSAPDANGMVYLLLNDSPLVYSIPASSLPWLEAQVHDLMAKLAILPHIDSVAKITVATDSESWTFLCSGESDEFTCTFEGKELPVDSFRKFYQSLIAASLDSVPEEPLPEDSAPVLTYTYEYKDSNKNPDIVRFYNGPARKYYITLNDGPEFLTPSTYIDKVLGDIPKLLAGEAVTSYM